MKNRKILDELIELGEVQEKTPLDLYKERIQFARNRKEMDIIKQLYDIEVSIENDKKSREYALEIVEQIKEGTYRDSIL